MHNRLINSWFSSYTLRPHKTSCFILCFNIFTWKMCLMSLLELASARGGSREKSDCCRASSLVCAPPRRSGCMPPGTFLKIERLTTQFLVIFKRFKVYLDDGLLHIWDVFSQFTNTLGGGKIADTKYGFRLTHKNWVVISKWVTSCFDAPHVVRTYVSVLLRFDQLSVLQEQIITSLLTAESDTSPLRRIRV